MTHIRFLTLFLSLLAYCSVVFISCQSETEMLMPEENEELSGGETTVFASSAKAFDKSVRNLSNENFDHFFVGNSFFRNPWVSAPASTTARDGLGPLFNAVSCAGCHVNDGRGTPPAPGGVFESMLIRLSIPGQTEHGGPLGDPTYGNQLNNKHILGVKAEGNVALSYVEVAGKFDDGETYTLRKPVYTFKNLGYGAMSPQILFSPRVAPMIPGLGLLQAINEIDILAQADPNDINKDGVSGRPNYVWDVVKEKKTLGRFGWKANKPTLKQQVAGAFLGDMGITSPLFPNENCTSGQTNCQQAPNGGSPEISAENLDAVTAYNHLVAVPARRNWQDGEVLKGKALFRKIGCMTCHTPKFTTGTLRGFPELSGQVIRPYTDLLLHDMGDDLADNRPDFEATGNEWRTPPLWGIGLVQTVNGHTNFMHDGRARNLQEAILWHGGEGVKAKEAYMKLSKGDRQAVIKFLESL
ncbi:di-heme oxidoreductase family protein [Microscilla marina]|nr:di-heme oxidoredictase family protein [Microscilla marina]